MKLRKKKKRQREDDEEESANEKEKRMCWEGHITTKDSKAYKQKTSAAEEENPRTKTKSSSLVNEGPQVWNAG